jgi:16S rRNA C1402 (ribose-2'-O) methylase RsmI
VIVLGGRTHDLPTTDDEIDAALRAELEAGSSVKDAASTVAELAGIPKREAYQRAMRLRD